jgi:hypothetical protein
MIGELLRKMTAALDMSGIDYDGMRLTIATPEDVLLAKMEWFKMGESRQQLVDAAGVLRMQRETIEIEYIEHWVGLLDLREQWAEVQHLAA